MSSIVSFYTGVIAKFAVCAKQSRLNTTDVTPIFEKVYDKKNKLVGWELTLNEPLDITVDISAGTPVSRALAANGILQILVLPKELYKSQREFGLKQSTVEVAYVLHSNVRSQLLMGFHFDFQIEENGDPKIRHPLFHVQLTDKLVWLKNKLLKDAVAVDSTVKLPVMRLPTAHMSFTATLINLAADNFEDEPFHDFIDDVRIRQDYPYMSNERFKTRMAKHEWRMRSCVWYPGK